MRLLSLFLLVASIVTLGVATTQAVGGFDWNREFVSTLLRGPAGTAQNLARVGVVLFCTGLALIYVRLCKVEIFAKWRSIIQIGGIGSCVYAIFTITPLHDLVVTISLIFYLTAAIALLIGLKKASETKLFAVGIISLAIQIFFATSYYTGFMNWLLPWGQRLTFGGIAIWLSLMDWQLPRQHSTPETI
ncbi:MAG TPA: hypothetical protein VK171_15460 [Fimbriimonas sp.]|nr:hypothetical protein [Fimbriimonas sp.]